MKMHNPSHPGEVLKVLCLDPLSLTVTEANRKAVDLYLRLGFDAPRRFDAFVWEG